MKTFTNKIEQETERAYKINLQVSWGGNVYNRSFWFPKSVCSVIATSNLGNPVIDVADWFASKMEAQNAFHGYFMTFAMKFE